MSVKEENERFWEKLFSNFRCQGFTLFCLQAGNQGCCWECSRLPECIPKWKELLNCRKKDYDIQCPISHMDKWCSQVYLEWLKVEEERNAKRI